MSVAHNLSVVSSFSEEQECWMHNLSVVVSELDTDNETIKTSEQISMGVLPAMPPEILVQGLRCFADAIEAHLKESEDASG